MFKCSTLSQYFQVKPAFFSRLFHVLPAEARLSAQNLSFCGENRREGASAVPIYFPGRPPGDAAEARDGQQLPPRHRASSFFIPASRPSTVRGNMGNTRAMAS